uniref:MATH domain-containing protein n=1 Tax=Oryza rufipogon TaxID=4529 RepID=A0A0E0RB64_ORYRU
MSLAAAAGRIVRTASAIVSRPSTTSHVLRVDGYSHLVGVLQPGEHVDSCVFDAGGHSWRLQLYPNGSNDQTHRSHIGVFLQLAAAGGHPSDSDGHGSAWLMSPASQRRRGTPEFMASTMVITGDSRTSSPGRNWSDRSIFEMIVLQSNATSMSQPFGSAMITRCLSPKIFLKIVYPIQHSISNAFAVTI